MDRPFLTHAAFDNKMLRPNRDLPHKVPEIADFVTCINRGEQIASVGIRRHRRRDLRKVGILNTAFLLMA